MLSLAAVIHGQEKMVLVATGSSMPEPLYKSWIVPLTTVDRCSHMAVGTAEVPDIPQVRDLGQGRCAHPEANCGSPEIDSNCLQF
jgi:hypothetical protein